MVPEQNSKEVVDGVDKLWAWVDVNKKDIAINKIELKWNDLKHRHVEIEVHAKQLYGESSQA